MADEIREYLKAAQAAENQGDKPRAIELLKKAAAMYRSVGNVTRALQMLRHARRLDGTREDLAEEVRRMEWIPDTSLARAVTLEQAEEDTQRAMQPLEDAEPKDVQRLIDRGPVKADPSVQAWCSFCCKPKAEVGELVAGPAGAFICGRCLEESSALLGLRQAASAQALAEQGRAVALPEVSSAPAPAVAPGRDEKTQTSALVGQAEGVAQLHAAIRSGARLILLLGPRGSGKTACLRELERQGLGVYASNVQELGRAPAGQRLLWDGEASPELLALLSHPRQPRQIIASARSTGLGHSFALAGDAADGVPLPIFSTQALVDGTGGLLPQELAERAEAVVSFRPLDVESLREVARQQARIRGATLDVSDEVLNAIAEVAARAPGGAHEAQALIQRIPAGTWTLAAAAASAPASSESPGSSAPAPAGRGSRKKKKAEGAS